MSGSVALRVVYFPPQVKFLQPLNDACLSTELRPFLVSNSEENEMDEAQRAAAEAELDQLKAERAQLRDALDDASDAITALDEQSKDESQDDPSKKRRAEARAAYQAAWDPWNKVDGQVHAAELALSGVEAGPDQKVGG